LVQAEEHISDALKGVAREGEEITAHHVRLALTALEELVGRTYTEDLLGRIFSQFCIGK
jgi:tRNA modification GTPase